MIISPSSYQHPVKVKQRAARLCRTAPFLLMKKKDQH